ncbi:Fc.00g005310.m01.CDS01 [Cosmosporella sp. VM-42]
MFSRKKGVGAAAYESDARYQPQTTEDRQWNDNGPRHTQKKPDYKPTPLRWYFVLMQIVFLVIAMGLVVFARQEMPNSDSTAHITKDKRWVLAEEKLVATRGTLVSGLPTEAAVLSDFPAEPTGQDVEVAAMELRRAAEEFELAPRQQVSETVEAEAAPTMERAAVLATSYFVSEISKTITVPGTTGKFTSSVPTTYYDTVTSIFTSTAEGSTFTSYHVTVIKTKTQIPITLTMTGSVSEETVVQTSTEYSLIPIGGTGTGTDAQTPGMSTSTILHEYTEIKEHTVPGEVLTTFTEVDQDSTITSGETIVEGGQTTVYSQEETQEITSVVPITGTTTASASIYIKLEKTTIMSIYTDPAPPMEKQPPKPTPKPAPKETVIDVVSVKPDETIKKVQTQAPVTFVTSVNEVETVVVSDPPPPAAKTIVTKVDAFETTVAVVSTAVDGAVNTVKVASTVAGGVKTITAAAAEQTIVTQVEGFETTLAVVTTRDDGVENTLKVVSSVSGGLKTILAPAGETIVTSAEGFETTIDVVTTGWDGIESTLKVVSTVSGGLKTIVAPPGETVVTSAEGYVTTIDIVTTGWDGLPTTSQLVSTVSGGLRTVVNRPKPTTYVTTRSGKLVTRTSTKKESTILSTIKGTTKTLQVSTTMTPTGTEATSEATGDSEDSSRIHKVPVVFGSVPEWAYFVGKFLPAMVTVLLSIPLRIIDLNAQLYQPFYAMNKPNGAYGASSMTLHYSGWAGFTKPFTTLAEGHPVPFLTMLTVWCSALMTPLATEAISMKIHGYCKISAAEGCALKLGVSPTPTHALIALIAFTIVLLCILLFYLRNFETGLYANPWSIAGIASLATNREIRPHKGTEKKIDKEMAEKRYGFGYFENADRQTEYGIVLYDDAGRSLQQNDPLSDTSSLEAPPPNRKRRINPFIALGWVWRLFFTIFLLGLIVLTTYYHIYVTKPSAFRTFMNSQTFGVRFFFAALGVGLTFGWTALFISVAMIQPYQRMANNPQNASDSILITRPTNGFSGLWASLKHKQVFPAVVAFMTILSEFMPILLANIPYTLTQTYETHVICARISIGIMGLMLLTLIGSFFIRFPNMPIDPRSIAGSMYYVSESAMVDQFSGLVGLDNKEREKRVKELGGRYWFGDILTKHGETRPAVERDDGMLGIENHPHHTPTTSMSQVAQGHGHNVDTAYRGYQPEDVHPSPVSPIGQGQEYHDDPAYQGYYMPEQTQHDPMSPMEQDLGYYQPEPAQHTQMSPTEHNQGYHQDHPALRTPMSPTEQDQGYYQPDHALR